MDLPLNGRAVELVTFSPFGLWLTFPVEVAPSPPGSEFVLRIDGPFRLVTSTADVEVDPNQGPDVSYLGLLGRTVVEAVATDDGTLAIRFVDGDRLTVRRDGAYESWMLSGNGQDLISGPGGLSWWSSDAK